VAVADLFTPGRTTAGYALSTEQEVVQTVEELRAIGVRAMGVPVDVTKFTELQVMVETVTRELGPIDILCNNAGVIDTALVVDTTEAQWDMMMNVNAEGVFLGCKAVVPGMMVRRQGRIINTASIAGKRGNARVSAYCASKFAVIGFTQSLAHEVASYNITGNCTQLQKDQSAQAQCSPCDVKQTGLSIRTGLADKEAVSTISNFASTGLKMKPCPQGPVVNCLGATCSTTDNTSSCTCSVTPGAQYIMEPVGTDVSCSVLRSGAPENQGTQLLDQALQAAQSCIKS
jgi:hypothetical protein